MSDLLACKLDSQRVKDHSRPKTIQKAWRDRLDCLRKHKLTNQRQALADCDRVSSIREVFPVAQGCRPITRVNDFDASNK